MALDGDIKLGLDLETKSAEGALSSFKNKLKQGFGSTNVKQLSNDIKNTTKTVNQLEREIERAQKKLEDLNEGYTAPKSITALEKELAKAQKQLEKLDADYKKFAIEQQDLVDRQIPGFSLEQSLNPEQLARFQELDNLIIQNGKDTSVLEEKISSLKSNISSVKIDPSLSVEGQKYTKQINKANAKLVEQKKLLKDLQVQQQKNSTQSSISLTGLERNLKRLKELVKSALFFSVITKAFTTLRMKLGELIMQNEGLRTSLYEIRGNLLTAFAPIWETLLPYLQIFLNLIVKLTASLANFLSMLFGRTIQQSTKAAKAIHQQTAAIKETGKEAKKTGKEIKKAGKELASFDTLNVFKPNDSDSDESVKPSQSSGGGAGTSVAPFKTDLTIDTELEERLKSILVLVGSIGGALALWKITTLLQDMPKFIGMLKKIGGIAMTVGGAILLIKNYSNAWVNGLDWKSFAGILAGVGLIVGGITLALGPLAGAFVLVGGGIALVVLGVKDIIDNGPTLQNILLIIAGVVAVGVGVWWALSAAELASLWPIALIVAAVVAVIAVFVILWNKCDAFREFWINLWEKIKEVVKNAYESIKQWFTELPQKLKENFSNMLQWFRDKFNNAKETIHEWITNVTQWVTDKFNVVKETFSNIMDSISNAWSTVWNGMKTTFVNIINGILNIFEKMVNGIISGVNLMINGLNNLVNKAGSLIGLNINIPTISKVNIPKLAQGAVIPANREFMAVLGDQKNGTNLEAPEGLIRQIVREESGGKNFTIKATGSMAQLIRLLALEIDEENKRRTVF